MSFEYVHAVDHNLLCPICQLAFVDPVLSPAAGCEHVFCRACILEHLRTVSSCPCDRRPLSASELLPAPRLVKLLVDELPVACTACRHWTGQRADWRRHTRVECGKASTSASTSTNADVACSNGCGLSVPLAEKAKLRLHELEQCYKRQIECDICGHKGFAEDAEQHAKSCTPLSNTCRHCGQEDIDPAKLSKHVAEVCPAVEISCPYARFGCTVKRSRASMQEEHLIAGRSVSCAYAPLAAFLQGSEQRMTSLESDNRRLSDRVVSLEADCSALNTRLSRLHQHLGASEDANGTDSLEERVGALRLRMGEMARAQSEARRAADRAHHDVRGEVNSLQMGLHELRGEMMAFQQAQYYEAASRLYGRSEASSSSNKDAKEPSEGGQVIQPAYTPGYPFPQYPGAFQPGQPMYGPALPGMMMQPLPPPPGRRFYGWPYGMYGGGGTSPDGGPGGGTKL